VFRLRTMILTCTSCWNQFNSARCLATSLDDVVFEVQVILPQHSNCRIAFPFVSCWSLANLLSRELQTERLLATTDGGCSSPTRHLSDCPWLLICNTAYSCSGNSVACPHTASCDSHHSGSSGIRITRLLPELQV